MTIIFGISALENHIFTEISEEFYFYLIFTSVCFSSHVFIYLFIFLFFRFFLLGKGAQKITVPKIEKLVFLMLLFV